MDDVSAISSSGCNVISSNNSISNYLGNTRKDYVKNGGTWYLYRTQHSNYGDYDTSSYNCIDITTLNSFPYMTPIYYMIGFCLCAFTLILFFKTIKGILYGN